MKLVGILVIFLLICRPTLGHEHEGDSGAGATTGHAETEGSETETGDDGNQSGETETGEATESGDDNKGITDQNENESDDETKSTTSTTSAVAKTASSVSKQSQKSLAAATTSLNSKATVQQIFDELQTPKDSGKSAVASAAILASTVSGSMSGETASVLTKSLALSVGRGAVAGKLSSNTVPEPATGLLLTMSALPLIWRRRTRAKAGGIVVRD